MSATQVPTGLYFHVSVALVFPSTREAVVLSKECGDVVIYYRSATEGRGVGVRRVGGGGWRVGGGGGVRG